MKNKKDLIEEVVAVAAVLVVGAVGVLLLFKWYFWCLSLVVA
jgi:hypothetical protein